MNENKKLYPIKFEQGTRVLDENSVISNGFLAENTIDDMIDTYLSDALGSEVFKYYRGEFPVKISQMEINDWLPLQTCPDDTTAGERYMAWGKSKLWYITKAEPSARLYLGFNKQMSAERFYNACIHGTIKDDLCVFTPEPGDCIYLKPGCVHSIGGGVELIEISQNSPVTYPLCDIPSEKKSGKKEKQAEYKYTMEIAEAIDIIDYSPLVKEQVYFTKVTENKTIADTSHFIVKSMDLTEEIRVFPSLINSFVIYICTRGNAHIKTNDNQNYSLLAGEMILIPESMEDFLLVPDKGNPHLLEVYMPQLQERESDDYLNYDEQEEDAQDELTDEEECHEHECECGHSHEHRHVHTPHHNHDEMEQCHQGGQDQQNKCSCHQPHDGHAEDEVHHNHTEDTNESDSHPGERFFKH